MNIEVVPVSKSSDIRKFIDFPFSLYRSNRFWVPPLKKAETDILQPHKNPAWEHCDAQFWIALKNGKTAGRIGAIINRLHNEKTGEQLCRFTRMEFIDDPDVSAALMETAVHWAKKRGMNGVHGPLGFTNLDSQGMLIEGFDHLPSIASVYHMPYYQKHLDALGFEKEIDWLEFRLFVPREITDKVKKINELTKARYGFTVKTFTRIADVLPYGRRMFAVLNRAFEDLFSVVPFEENLMDFYIKKYISLLNPNFIKLVFDKDNQLAGFIIGVPSLSQAMQKANGSLLPFGWYHISQALKKPKEADLFLTAVDPQYQGGGLTAMLILELQQTFIKYGISDVETTGMIETNQKAIQNWKNFDHIQHKRKRCYRRMF